jgi:hypothetical protein
MNLHLDLYVCAKVVMINRRSLQTRRYVAKSTSFMSTLFDPILTAPTLVWCSPQALGDGQFG